MKKLLFALMLMLTGALTASAAKITTEGVKPTYGSGSKNDPYQIRTAENLRWFVHYENTRFVFPNDYAILIFDIDLKDICGPDKGSWIPLGYTESYWTKDFFDGCIDGNGRTISNLYIDGNDFEKDAAIGFMGKSQDACAYNLTVEGQIINPTDLTGGLVGELLGTYNYPTFYGCVSKVKITGNVPFECAVGGLVGLAFWGGVHLVGCVYDGDMTMLEGDLSYVGGIIGNLPDDQPSVSPIQYCVSNTRAGLPMIGNYNPKDATTAKQATIRYCITDGPVFGKLVTSSSSEAPSIENVLYCGSTLYNYKDATVAEPPTANCFQIDEAILKSGQACYDMNQLSIEYFGQNLDSDGDDMPYPPQLAHPTVYKMKNYTDCVTYEWTYNNSGIDNLTEDMHTFSEDEPFCTACHTAVNPSYNTAKEDDYYLLRNADEVRWFWNLVNESAVSDAKARVKADIEMDEGVLKPLANFSGEIDGQGHVISNLNIKAFYQYGGLVEQLKSGGSIHDLTIAGSVSANNCYFVGGFAGLVEDGASLYNLRNDCKVENKVFAMYSASTYLGGIAGLVRGSIHRCINDGPVIDTSSYYNGTYHIGGVSGFISSDASFSYLVNNAAVGSQGLRSAYGSAVANYSGSTSPTGIYYVEIDNPGINYFFSNTKSNGASSIDRKDVGSGELCYLLDYPNTDESLYFGQTIGTDYVPYPGVSDAHKRVYNNKRYYNCTNYYNYSNLNYDGTPVTNHEYNGDGYCKMCYHADVAQEGDVYQISSADDWTKYAKAVNAASENGHIGCFASAALVADIDLDASTYIKINNLCGNIDGKGHTITFTNDPGHQYSLIENVGATAAIGNLNVQFTESSSGIIHYNKGNASACSAIGGQIYAVNHGVVTDCYADCAFAIAETGEGYLLRCLQRTLSGSEMQYTVLSKTKGTAECSVKEVFSQAQEQTGELAYYISHLDSNQPCVWGEVLGSDSHPKPCYGQTPASDTFVTRLTTYSAEHPDGIVEYMNAGMALEAVPGTYMVCEDTEPWTVRPAYNFIVDNGNGTYSAEQINLDPTVQNFLPIEVNADRLTFKETDGDGNLAAKNYGFGEIISLVFPTDMPVDNVNGHVYVFDGYDALNNTLVFTSSLDEGDCDIPAHTPVLVRTYGGSLLNDDLAGVTVMQMAEVAYSELESVRHIAGYSQQELPAGKTVEDGQYVLYYLLGGDKDDLKATVAKDGANTAAQLASYFRMPYVSSSSTQDEISVALVEDRELKTSRLVERDIFSIPYGSIEGTEWMKAQHLSDKNVFYGNDVTRDIYANISAYDFLYIHGAPGQRYQFYFNGPDATEVVIDGDGDAFIDLDEHRVGIGDVYLRGIRLAQGETVPDDAFAKLYKYLEEGLVLYGYGDFSDDLKGYPFYDATGVKCGITLNLDNPNAMVVGGSNVKGVYNRIVKSENVMQGFTAERLRLTDGGDFCYDYSVKCPDVTFTRYDVPEQTRYVTFVLPFAVNYVKGMHEYVDCDGENVYFNTPEDGVIDAYLPIVIDMEEYDGSTITITGQDFVALSPNGVFNVAPAPSSKYNLKYGFVTRRQAGVSLDNAEVADYDVYGFSTTSYKFVRAVNTFSIDPFRAFFMLPKAAAARVKGFAAPANVMEALDIVLDGEAINGGTTGIEDVIGDSTPADAPAYNVLGMPVGPDYRGIVIRNGKKLITK